MRIELKDENQTLTLTNDGLDNDSYVELLIEDEIIGINIDELLSAVHAFEQLRVMRIARENKYQD